MTSSARPFQLELAIDCRVDRDDKIGSLRDRPSLPADVFDGELPGDELVRAGQHAAIDELELPRGKQPA